MKIYIVAQSSDEYSDTLQLRDVLSTSGGISPYWTSSAKSMAFKSLDEAQAYLNSFDGKSAHSDGSGNLRDDLSIFESEMDDAFNPREQAATTAKTLTQEEVWYDGDRECSHGIKAKNWCEECDQ